MHIFDRLIGWDIFDFSETTEPSSRKLGRKQDLNDLYQVFVIGLIWANRKTRLQPWPPIG